MKKYLSIALLLSVAAAQAGTQDDWRIVAPAIDPARYQGVTLANGMIGLVSSPEPMKVAEVVLNGAFDNYGRGRVDNILKGFNFMNVNLEVDGQRVEAAQVANLRQTLDMKQALLITEFDLKDKVPVRHSMAALRQLPYTALATVEITARRDVAVTPSAAIAAPDILRDVHNLYAQIDRPHVRLPLMTSVGKSPSGKHTVAAAVSMIFEPGAAPALVHEDLDYNNHLTKFSTALKAGATLRFSVVGSMLSSAHLADPHNEAERLTIYAALEGRERLMAAHRQAWEALWSSDVLIEGDPAVQRDMRLALYHLYSFAREGTAYSLSPMGLSGLGYNGHVFWDAELWMMPPLLALHPELAKSMLEYRFQRLGAARENARNHGYKGAMFPWESASEGHEVTPVWALTGPFQQHITGCVGWAFWKYYQVTHDRQWLRERGYPMLKEVADFWASRVERTAPGRYEINNVIGANEWQENIDNNAFTNGMAITVLRYASQAARELGVAPDPDWEHVAANIPILRFADGTTRENASYDGVPIKQADVNLLAYPLDIVSDPVRIGQDLAYYGPRLAPEGPAMGRSVIATLQARAGQPEQAYASFLQSYQGLRVAPFGVLEEYAGGRNPYFATGAGGTLQALLFGFGGLYIDDTGIHQRKTALPKHWKQLQLRGVGIERATLTLP
ncbi:MAG TPA: glycoside hydrolase family 65 protein [Duganella sp.]|nr:glycoside hydrolase family 65 protein [Duganella sp.]